MSRDLLSDHKVVNLRANSPLRAAQERPSRLGKFAWLPIPVLLSLITILYALHITARFEPAYLMMTLNVVFLSLVLVFVALLAAKTYLAGGEPAVLFLGCGMWVLGITCGIAGVLDYLDIDAFVVTVEDGGAFLAGVCILISAISTTFKSGDKPAIGRGLWLPFLYLITLGTIVLLTICVFEGIIPPFFKPGAGATPLRQVVIIAACLEFAVSSILFATLCRRSATSFLRWYTMGLALIAIGFLGVIPQTPLGTPSDWAARLAQYLGAIYILFAVFSAFRQYHTWGIPLGKAFQELEQRYRSLVELCPDAILVHSEGRYVYANPAAARLFGAESPADLIGKDVMELVAPDFRDLGRRRIQQAYEGAVTPLQELRFIRFDDRLIDVESIGTRVEFGGRPAIQVVARDITEMKSAAAQLTEAKREAERRAQELEESKRILDALMEHIPEGITIANAPDARTVMTSKYGARILGYGREETRGLSMEDWLAGLKHYLADGTTPAKIEDLPLWKAVKRGETVQGQEMVLQKGSGDQLHVLCNAGPITDKDANVAGGIVAWRDITERKLAEEKLRQSEERLRFALDVSEMGHWDLDLEDHTAHRSLKHDQIFGYEEPLSRWTYEMFLEHVVPEDRELVEKKFRQASEERRNWDFECRIIRCDKTMRWIWACGRLLVNDLGEPKRLVGIVQDITSRKETEEALRLAMADLDRRVQERTEELSRTVDTLQIEVAQRTLAEQALLERSEQLRLLSSELTLAEQRERQRLAQILHDGLQQILVGAKFRLALMQRPSGKNLQQVTAELDDLIDEAIETSRSLTAELSPPSLHEFGLVPALEWLARWMHDKHGLTLELKANAQAEPVAEDVKVLLFQATRELLFNVVKHAGVKTVRVQMTPGDSRILVVVSDEGKGFDPTQVRAVGGSAGGFGLFSIRERIHLLGGEMVIDSAPGRGTRITLAAPFPATRDAAGTAPAERDSKISVSTAPRHIIPAGVTENKIRVVLVDDHIVMRQGLARLLQEATDMEIVGEASDGEAAVHLVRQTLPHVVLMDISMPGMNGIQATQIIHAELPDIRIIGLSMFEEGEQAAAMRAAGAAEYLTKSGPADAIIHAIRACATRAVGSVHPDNEITGRHPAEASVSH